MLVEKLEGCSFSGFILLLGIFLCYFPSIKRRGILLSIVSVLGSTEMIHLNNEKKNNFKVTATAKVLSLTITIILIVAIVILGVGIPLTALASGSGTLDGAKFYAGRFDFEHSSLAPAVVSGDNIYLAWWTNNTENGNEEVMFRASTDGGATFTDKINLSNTTDADSISAEISAEGGNVVVTWWERNQTSDTPVARVSNDAGETFGPLIMLGTNGTITTTIAAAPSLPTVEQQQQEEGDDEETTVSTETSLADPNQQSSLDQHDDLASITIIDRAGPPSEVDNEQAEQ
jgi:hypothetical protein